MLKRRMLLATLLTFVAVPIGAGETQAATTTFRPVRLDANGVTFKVSHVPAVKI